MKTDFESPEIEEFLREMYKEGLSQDNSDYDLSSFNLDDVSKDSSSEEKTNVDKVFSSELMEAEPYMSLLANNELSDDAAEKIDDSETTENMPSEENSDRVSSY